MSSKSNSWSLYMRYQAQASATTSAVEEFERLRRSAQAHERTHFGTAQLHENKPS